MQLECDRFNQMVPESDWPVRLFRLSPALLCIAGTDGYFKRVNPAFQEKLGHTEAALLAQPFIEFVHPDDRESTLDQVGKLSTGIPAIHFENRYRHADGTYRWLLWNTTPVASGLLYAAAIDITDRKASDEQHRTLLNAVPDSIIFVDRQGKMLNFNHATESLFGYTRDELNGRSIELLVRARFHDRHRQHRDGDAQNPLPRLMKGGQQGLAAVRKDGQEFPIEVSLGPVDDQMFICVVRDISLRMQRERELEASRRLLVEDQRLLRGLSTRLVMAEESERRRIGRGLHDDVGHSLLAAKLCLEEILENPAEGDVGSIEKVKRLVDSAIETTRTLSFELASAALYEVGVGAALQSECELAQKQSGIRFRPPVELRNRSVPMEVKIILHRVGRELIRNIVRHSNARTATLSLSTNGAKLELTVADDGQGFKNNKITRCSDLAGGFGLFSIEQQLDSIGGRLDIASSPRSGTRIAATVPVQAGAG